MSFKNKKSVIVIQRIMQPFSVNLFYTFNFCLRIYYLCVFLGCTENDEFVVVPDSSTPFNTKTEGKKTPRRSVKRKAGDNLNGTCPPPVPPIAMTPKRSCSTKNTPKKLNISPLSLPTIAENTKTSRRTSFGNDNDVWVWGWIVYHSYIL